MSPSDLLGTLPLIGHQRTEAIIDETEVEQNLRARAARAGLRFEKSRRHGDHCCGPTVYWLFDQKTHRLVSSKSGWSLEHVRHHLNGAT